MSTSNPVRRLHGELETSWPARARAGLVSFTGWCVAAGERIAPPVRLVAGDHVLPAAGPIPRQDVPVLLPAEPAAGSSGFTLEGRLPAGVYLARLEAQWPDGRWTPFKTFTLAVEPRPFSVSIEAPVTHAVHDRVHVEGWALDPRQALKKLSLRYGHQEIPCAMGRPRADLATAFPEAPEASRAGFKSAYILSAGRGPLRVKALLADGTPALARTRLTVDIRVDENHDGRIDFGAIRTSLPRPAPVAPPAPFVRAGPPLNVLFLLPGSFASNSALHVAALANELGRAGYDCVVAVSHDLETLGHHTAPVFRGCLHQDTTAGLGYRDGRGPDLIHAWTTRENVRQLAETLRGRHRCRLVVHLEDNEQELLAQALHRPAATLAALADVELARLVPSDLSHPRRAREFLAGADAVTVITEALREFVPAGRPVQVVQPAADARYFFPQPVPIEFRRLVDRTPDETVLFYHGNVHAANAAEVRELYRAVLQLNRAGETVTLIRTGRDQVDFLGGMAPEVAPHVISLGQILRHRHLPPLMALADVFVQPGEPGSFNDYRFPSKLPEFFSLGRPVILPRTNLGTQVRHGQDAYVLEHADANGIGAAVTALRRDPALAARLGTGAAAFAAKHFHWRTSAEALAKLYAGLTAS